jgi:hypothetical protein
MAVPDQARAADEIARLRHLGRLGRLGHGLTAVVAAPSGVWAEVGVGLAAVALVCLWVFGLLVQGWMNGAARHRRVREELIPLDWTGQGWRHVRTALEEAGLDLDEIRAYGTFASYPNLVTQHRPRDSLGRRLRGMADWSAEHNGRLIAGGAGGGVALAVANEVWPGWYDRPAFWAGLGAVCAVLFPLAAWNGHAQLRLNMLRPESIVIFPSQWRTLLRRDIPGHREIFLHEVSHVRHNDAGRRRAVEVFATYAKFIAFVDAGVAFTVQAGAAVQMSLFLVIALSGILGVRGATRTLRVVQELRADAEACTRPRARENLRSELERLFAERMTPQLRLRLLVLDAPWSTAGSGAALRAMTLGFGGFAAPALTLFTLLWTGVLAPAPDL